ncbi:hypothetical protein [Saccharopolyspora erythraea]|uniref:hypothetical protein n=1 Tax=Saccharopolyspora erythraea TaxID=1836 RepID=UPI0020127336|nr:hypothetical protein [Saccharopolyspora erythraea]
MTESIQRDADSQEAACPHARTYPFGDPGALDLDPDYARVRDDEPLTRIRMPIR